MRCLTIKREKTFVACAGKLKIYIEDPTSNEQTINGVPCRKLGTIKNGEEQKFSINDERAKVFVIADTLSKNFCNEFYEIPEGTNDIYLSGKNKFNPGNGNAFRFNDNNNPEVLASRKKGTMKGTIILIIALIIGMICGSIIGNLVAGAIFG